MSHCDAFDYWGKGTQVTVTSSPTKAPAVFMMSDCSSSGPRLLGCLASDFSPEESVSFKWIDQSGKTLTDFVQYPTVKINEKMLKLSHITVTKETLKKSITCQAIHPSKTENKTFIKAQAPTVSVIPVTTQKSTSVMCVIEDYYPKGITVQWKLNNDILQQQTEMEYKQNEDTRLYTALNLYKVNSETWNKHIDYTCEVTHMGQVQLDTKNFKATMTLTLKTPIQRELFVHNKVILQAVISGNERNSVQSASVSCKMENKAITLQKGVVQSPKDISEFQKIHNVTVDTEKWFKGEQVTCSISDKNIKKEIYFNKGDANTPNITLYEQNVNNTDPTRVSLVCEVTSPKLGDVYIMWTEGNGDYIEGYTSAPIRQKDSTSVVSIYEVSKEELAKNTISCAVKHANMKGEKPTPKSTSQNEPPEPETGFALHCNEDVLEEDEFRSLWSTATSFIFLFLFSLTYGALLSLSKKA
ncbi:immunoglobulin Z heavy chain constant region [Triplophysa rosa]|nr:immunoglobulin Z heavy chain constant region [Triplophysa rosa]